MKYLLLICVDPDIDVTPEQASPERWVEEMDGRGVRLEGHALDETGAARTVRVRDGDLALTDGPFAETKEQMAGFDVIECRDLEEAVEVASKHPVARFGAIEIRPFREL